MALPFQVTKNWLNLSSSDRSSGDNNNFTINFNSGGLTNNSGGFYGSTSYINPVWFSFPNNAPNIQTGWNNVFYIGGNLFGASGVQLTLDQGLYQNVAQLTTALQTKINAALLAVSYTATVTVQQFTSTIGSLNYNHILFTLVLPAASETVSVYLYRGIPGNFVSVNPLNFGSIVGTDENVFTLQAGSLTHYLPYLPNLQVYDIVQIKCNLCRSTYEIENKVLSSSLIMVSFPTANFTVNDSILFSNNNPDLYRQEMNGSNFGTIEIQITDKNGRLIPFFGACEFSIIIEREQYNEPINLSRAKGDNPYTAPMFYQ
jgi:hypothetical protein